jgi:hypothetical protein
VKLSSYFSTASVTGWFDFFISDITPNTEINTPAIATIG